MPYTHLPEGLIDRLPSPKGVALALTKACRSEDVSLDEIAALVQTDPALSARLLALANAAAAGGRTVLSAQDAVARMGLVRISQLALAFSLIDQHHEGACANFDYAGFWNRSLLMAAAASEFGAPLGLGASDHLFTVGLLAQIGRLALATAFPKDYSGLVAQEISAQELLQREVAIAQINHVDLSVALMEDWGIPIEYARPFGLHESSNVALFKPQSIPHARAILAHSCWQVAAILSTDGVDALLGDPESLATLQWLALDPEALAQRLAAIESAWRIWLTLIARQG